MTISDALRDIGVPVCHPPYRGPEETYITYQILGQAARVYAEGTEAETATQFAVSIYAEGCRAALIRETKAALERAGYIVTVDMEHYDREIRRTQVAMIAETEGAVYG